MIKDIRTEVVKVLDDSSNEFIKNGTIQDVEITGEEGGVYYGNARLLIQ